MFPIETQYKWTPDLYVGQERAVRNLHGKTDWLKIGKWVQQGFILSLCLFKLYAEYIMQSASLYKGQAGIKIAGEISTTSYMQIAPL